MLQADGGQRLVDRLRDRTRRVCNRRRLPNQRPAVRTAGHELRHRPEDTRSICSRFCAPTPVTVIPDVALRPPSIAR